MQSIINNFHTYITNSGLTAEDQELLLRHFTIMNAGDQYSLLSVISSDPNQIPVAVDFLKTFANKKDISTEEYDKFLTTLKQGN